MQASILGRISLIILIDGYNLLRHTFYNVKGKLVKQREQFIRQLGYYKSKKSIGKIIAVFDGGLSRHATREVHGGVVVMYSGQKSSADDWILDFVKKNKEKEMLLVTMDNELKDKCANYGVDNIGVKDFYDLVQNSLLEEVVESFSQKTDQVQKFDDLDDSSSFDAHFDDYGNKHRDSQAIDMLMEQTILNSIKKDDTYSDLASRKSKAKTLSKKEKKVYKKIKKL